MGANDRIKFDPKTNTFPSYSPPITPTPQTGDRVEVITGKTATVHGEYETIYESGTVTGTCTIDNRVSILGYKLFGSLEQGLSVAFDEMKWGFYGTSAPLISEEQHTDCVSVDSARLVWEED